MRRQRRLLEKLAVVERADTIAEMPRGSLDSYFDAFSSTRTGIHFARKRFGSSNTPKQYANHQHDIGDGQNVEHTRRADDRDGNMSIMSEKGESRQYQRNHEYHE